MIHRVSKRHSVSGWLVVAGTSITFHRVYCVAMGNQPQATRQPSISPPPTHTHTYTMIIACEHRVVSELNNVAQRFTVDAREVHYFMEQWSRTSMIHESRAFGARCTLT